MPWCPFAERKPVAPGNYSADPISHKFIVVHVASGLNQGGTDAWFNNPASQVSAHFSIALNGDIHQYVDTNETAYHCADWNGESIGIEHEGLSGQHLTKAQKTRSKLLMKWIVSIHDLQVLKYTQNPHDKLGGVIGHCFIPEPPSLAHPDCPGTPILKDVQVFLAKNPVAKLFHVLTRPLP